MPDRLSVRVKEAARLLNVSVRTLYRMIAAGELQLRKLRGRSVVRVADLKGVLNRDRGSSATC